jgi:putative ABC transport system permease protein
MRLFFSNLLKELRAQGGISQKLRSFRGLKAGDSDNFFINVFSGFTDLIDGIILNMKFGGWI